MMTKPFFKALIVAGTLLLLILNSCTEERFVSFGVISDVHQDIMHDGPERLGRFIEEMNTLQPDFIIQLGDFCRPYKANKGFLSIYNDFVGPRYHVLGNHDMDGGFSRDSVVSFWESPAPYYSFDQQGFHFIVLDGNDRNPDPNRPAGYNKYIGEEQKQWLLTDLKSTHFPTVVFSHQAFRGTFGIDNSDEIRAIFEAANAYSDQKKVVACFNGHNHGDSIFQIGGVFYIDVNSASYDWLGEAYKHTSYSKEIHEAYSYLSYTAPYEQPLWALIEIGSRGSIRIKGKESRWVGPSPFELGHPGRADGLGFSSRIRDTLLVFK